MERPVICLMVFYICVCQFGLHYSIWIDFWKSWYKSILFLCRLNGWHHLSISSCLGLGRWLVEPNGFYWFCGILFNPSFRRSSWFYRCYNRRSKAWKIQANKRKRRSQRIKDNWIKRRICWSCEKILRRWMGYATGKRIFKKIQIKTRWLRYDSTSWLWLSNSWNICSLVCLAML